MKFCTEIWRASAHHGGSRASCSKPVEFFEIKRDGELMERSSPPVCVPFKFVL